MISHAITIVRTANAAARWAAVKLAKIDRMLTAARDAREPEWRVCEQPSPRLCVGCSHPTMHMGELCYGCTQACWRASHPEVNA